MRRASRLMFAVLGFTSACQPSVTTMSAAVYPHERGRWMIVQAHESLPVPEQAPARPPRRRS